MKKFLKKYIPKYIVYGIKAVYCTLYSAIDYRLPFVVFFAKKSKWFININKNKIPVYYPSIAALEYYHKYIPVAGDVVYDVGGELGLEAEQFSILTKKSGQVHVFECLPTHIEGLKKLGNKYPQILLHEIACWNKEEILEFHVGHTAGSGSAITDAKGQYGQSLANLDSIPLRVNARKLDDVWRENGAHHVNFMKMDIEGAEYEALEGAEIMLKHTSNVAIASYHIRNGIPTAKKVEQILKNSGFETRIDKNLHVYGWR